MTWRRWLGVALLVPLLAVLGFAGWLLGSEGGARWALGLAGAQVPGLALAGVSGDLAGGIRLQQLDYDDGAGTRLRLEAVTLDWRPAALLRGEIRIQTLAVGRMRLGLPAGSADPAPLALPQLSAPWPLSVTRLAVDELTVTRGGESWRLVELATALRLDTVGLALSTFAIQSDQLQLSGQGRIGAVAPHPLDLELDWRLDGPSLPRLAGRLALGGDLRQLQLTQRVEGELSAQLAGSIMPDLAGGAHGFDLSGRWAGLELPTGDGPLRSEQGEFAIAGHWPAYRLTLNARLAHPLAGQWGLRLSGEGDGQGLSVGKAQFQGLGGRLDVAGHVAWLPEPRLALELAGKDLDPAPYLAQWPGTLDLGGRLNGRLVDGEPALDLVVHRLAGELRGYPVSASGGVGVEGGVWRLRDIALRSGANSAWLDGTLMPRLALDLQLDAPQLAQMVPGASGALRGTARISGQPERLALQLDVDGSALRWGDLALASVLLQGELDPFDAQRSRWRLQATGLLAAGQRFDELRLDGTGNAATHRFTGQVRAPWLTADLSGSGSYRALAWQARLDSLDLAPDGLGQWQLQAPLALTVDGAGQRVDRFCLASGQARACAAASRAADGVLQAEADWSALPLALLQPWLALDTELTGSLAGQLALQAAPAGIGGEGSLSISPGEIRIRPDDGPELVTTHRDGHLKAQLSDGRLSVTAGWLLGPEGEVRARLAVDEASAAGHALTGEVTFGLPDAAPLAALLPRVTGLAGPVQLRSVWRGTVEQPQVSLTGHWSQGQLTLPELGITLTDLDLAVTGDGDRLRLAGYARSAPGELRLEGQLRLDPAAGWPLALRLDGEDFTVAQRADVEARVSPALDLAVRRGLISADGRLAVPYARIVGDELKRGAVRASEDEVLVGEQRPAEQQPQRPALQMATDVQLLLGDQVSLDAHGLTGRLTGEMRLHQRPGTRAEGAGQLNIVDGRYKAYGQDLTIDRGRLLFAGPLENPDVDVRASRVIGDVTAGILLGGRLQSPTVELFSEPAMDQAEVLSYLVTGGPLGGSGAFSSLLLTEAAVGLGVDRSGAIASQLAGNLGLDEFKIESGGGGLDSSMMSIGKRLSPELYLRYLYGLFDSSSVVQIRYRISERVRLEVEDGQGQAADIIYELEKD